MAYKMISLARTPEEIKKDMPSVSVEQAAAYEGPRYPWGTSLRLEKDTLDKLGHADLPAVGDVFEMCIKVRVTSVSQSENESTAGATSENKCVELQVTDMGLPAPSDSDVSIERSEKRKSSWYGTTENDTGKGTEKTAAA